MIIVLYGQPNSGKTTLARKLVKVFKNSISIDGDDLRKLFSDKDYSKEGRIKNLNRASDIAVYMESLGTNVIVSLMYPYKETREYLSSIGKDVVWIYLVYDGIRGREEYHLKEFEIPSYGTKLNTSDYSIEECSNIIYQLIQDLNLL